MDISHLTLDELHELNEQVCARIDEVRAYNDKMALARLLPSMSMQFIHENVTITGVLLKNHRKTVLIASENGKKQFKVPAGIVSRAHTANTKISQAVKNGLK